MLSTHGSHVYSQEVGVGDGGGESRDMVESTDMLSVLTEWLANVSDARLGADATRAPLLERVQRGSK